jgi:hypothetical protein
MQPYDYSIDAGGPVTSMLEGYKLGLSIDQLKQEREYQKQARDAALQKQQADLAQQQEYQKMVQDFWMKENKTPEDYERIAFLAPKDKMENVLKVWDKKTEQQKQSAVSQTMQIVSALRSDTPELGIDLLAQRSEAEKNSGQAQLSEISKFMAEQAKKNPKLAADNILLGMAALPEGRDALKTYGDFSKTKREEELAPYELQAKKAVADEATVKAKYAEEFQKAGLNERNWSVKNLQSMISDRAAKLALDRQQTAALVAEKMSNVQKNINDIPTDSRKLINESAVSAASSKQSATRLNDLANRFEQQNVGFGSVSKLNEYLKNAAGMQDGLTSLRNEYSRVKNSEALKSLPIGTSSNQDVLFALKGMPDEFANSATLARFLRGMAKLQEIEASVSEAKVDWLSNNKGMLSRAGSDFDASGYKIRQGESFNDLSSKIYNDFDAKEKAKQPKQQAAGTTPYSKLSDQEIIRRLGGK